jgi:hypothetical protein
LGFSRILDIDGDGEITVEEFVSSYLKMRKTSSTSGLAARAKSVTRRVKVKKALKKTKK